MILFKVTMHHQIKITKIEVGPYLSIYNDGWGATATFYRATFEEAHNELLKRLLNRKDFLKDALDRVDERYQYALNIKEEAN